MRSLEPAWARSSDQSRASLRQGPDPIDLTIDEYPLEFGGRLGRGIAMNGSIPGPIVRLQEGREAVIRVTNRLKEVSSVHWHGLILPPEMDGVPGVSFPGIKPGETFTYRFPVTQSGTYWCHSHSGGQELLGVYAPLVVEPTDPEPFQYDRDYVVLLSDWSFESPAAIIGRLKNMAGYYNFSKRTVFDFARDVGEQGLGPAFAERRMWNEMNMDPTDIADVTGATYTYLLNGKPPEQNWTALFRRRERLRLRFIDAAAMTFFDVRIPGMKMTLVQADGQNVQPVTVDEFRIGPGETYDMIVEPHENAYTIFAESMDRSGYALGTLAVEEGMRAPVPSRRKRPVRDMADMGMAMSGHGSDHGEKTPVAARSGGMQEHGSASGHASAGRAAGAAPDQIPWTLPVKHGPDHHGVGNSAVAELSRSRLAEPGIGLSDSGRRVLLYTDLRSLTPGTDRRPPGREVELHLTGNMERYMWSFDGKKYSEAKEPIPFHYGERLRLTLVNDTMMEHPMHLHGMWMELENGAGEYKPRKHTIVLKPAERWSVAITADAPGRWAFHCHLLLHMEMGMFRVVEVSDAPRGDSA